MKHCPACNFTFPDFHLVCDFDGTELIPDPERLSLIKIPARRSHLRAVIVSPKALTAVAIVGLFSQCGIHRLSPNNVSIDSHVACDERCDSTFADGRGYEQARTARSVRFGGPVAHTGKTASARAALIAGPIIICQAPPRDAGRAFVSPAGSRQACGRVTIRKPTQVDFDVEDNLARTQAALQFLTILPFQVGVTLGAQISAAYEVRTFVLFAKFFSRSFSASC
jgi:hypothetical protein